MARVSGITKTNTSVFPETRGDGFCARLDTRMESVKVLGIVDITVLAAGSMFWERFMNRLRVLRIRIRCCRWEYRSLSVRRLFSSTIK